MRGRHSAFERGSAAPLPSLLRPAPRSCRDAPPRLGSPQLLDLVEYRVAQDTPFDVKWAKRFTEPNGDHPFKDCKTWAEFYEAREKMEERIRRGSGQRTFAGDKDAYWVRQE